jgi:myb proto-oncogene protein
VVPGRTGDQCRQRWVGTLDPANGRKSKWTPEEDAMLTEAVENHGKDWVAVAAMVPGRNNVLCRERWVRNMDPANGKKRKWTPEEDAKLTKAVKKHGKDWVAAEAMVAGRSSVQCRNRWVLTLDPVTRALEPANGKKGQWTPKEDAKLSEAINKHGKEWVTVVAMVPGRTIRQCRQRWTNTLDPANGKNTAGKWTPEEDAMLTEAVEKHGKEWVPVAAMVTGRTNVMCRQRWIRNLDLANGKNAGEWTLPVDEDAKLTEAVKKSWQRFGRSCSDGSRSNESTLSSRYFN